MRNDMYSVEQVADLLGLHVRTVRGYIRSGRLNAVRIGKQYRVAQADLEALTGRPVARPPVEVSSIVRVDGVDRTAADRLGTLIQAAATSRGHTPPLHIQTVHDENRNHMTIVIMGGLTATNDVLSLLDSVLDGVLRDA
ncbi:helix-turn-helix domain-containing protein [Actinokineospora sp. HUAS TT18]|uniref:helix-turn-helix domain-containing protein n=1 Tax=Actinokineospora sp. HUAS TT18 TaxID=3447451 RepID=UPI003F525EF6